MAAGKHIIILILFFSGFCSFSQDNFLARKITLNCQDCRLETALKKIGTAGQFRFSYDASLFPSEKKVDIVASNAEVGKVLREVLGKDVRMREVGNHVILVKNRNTDNLEKKPEVSIITGTVTDAENGDPLQDVTIYDISRKKSAVTSAKGAFRIEIPGVKGKSGLVFCKRGFADTVIFINPGTAKVRVGMKTKIAGIEKISPVPARLEEAKTDSLGFVQWLVPRETMINSENLEDRTTSTFQASIIPYIGTNWKVTGSVTNRFSLNILAGYTGGLKGVEIGGLLNITKKNIDGLQIGGLGNIVGGDGNGWQIGGLFNYDMGRFKGVQIGGLMNYVPDTITGVQIGGLANVISGKISGVQIAGLMNLATKNSDGCQIAGLTNLTLGESKKIQIAGLCNYGNSMEGLQLAGLVNIARKGNYGIQIAGLFNYATTLHGVQIGLINVVNNVERGVPIGLFSYAANGYHVFEISGNEIFYGNAAFKSGTRSFYNFFQLGMGSDYKLQGLYGIGSIFSIGKKLSVSIDASAGFVYHPVDTVYHGLLLKGYPALEYKMARHFAIFGGPSWNFFLFPKGDPSATPRGLSTYDFYFRSTENASIQMWIGGMIGIRI